jgi:hypothetical protein
MNGNGGTAPARSVAGQAAKTVMSGPASGVMAAAVTLQQAGIANAVTYDMGGTSTDVALIGAACRRCRRAHARLRPADPRADGGRAHGRGRRRLDRVGRQGPAC